MTNHPKNIDLDDADHMLHQKMEQEIKIDDGLILFLFRNEDSQSFSLHRKFGTAYIQLHFGIKGKGNFFFNADAVKLQEEKSLLLYSPHKELPLDLELAPNSWLASVVVSLENLQSLLGEESDYFTFLDAQADDLKFCSAGIINPLMAIVLHQIFYCSLHPSVKKLYYKAKTYELLSLYFNRTENTLKALPFLNDNDNVRRIRKAQEIIIANMSEPPALQELADKIGLHPKKLKMGFKQIYGDTLYGYLLDYKMDFARKLLDSGCYNVNEVGLKIGYSSGSHFIAGFKKKFSTTPKKYLMSINANFNRA